jgi:hypothetical protein
VLTSSSDISISTVGILNPEPAQPMKKPIKASPGTPKEDVQFAFLNISKPSQASSRENKRFVKSFVRHQTVKSVKAAKDAGTSQKKVEIRNAELERCKRVQLPPVSKSGASSSPSSQQLLIRRPHPKSRSWEILTWSQRYPKATYDELMDFMGNETYRIDHVPYKSNVVYVYSVAVTMSLARRDGLFRWRLKEFHL